MFQVFAAFSSGAEAEFELWIISRWIWMIKIRCNLIDWCEEKRCGLSPVTTSATEVHLTITFLSFPTFFTADKCIHRLHFYHFQVFDLANAFNTSSRCADPLMSWLHQNIIFSAGSAQRFISKTKKNIISTTKWMCAFLIKKTPTIKTDNRREFHWCNPV